MTKISEFSTPFATEISVARSFSGGLQRVWEVWAQARHLKHCWGPEGFATPVCEVDFRPGGA